MAVVLCYVGVEVAEMTQRRGLVEG